jgi:hypothetical protein
VLTEIHTKAEADEKGNIPTLSNELANLIFSVLSVSIVYSYLALESFLNYHLHELWKRRHDNTEEGALVLELLGDEKQFITLKRNDKVREVPDRMKTICKILAYKAPHKAIPDTWRRLNEFVETSRHFVVHPYPDPDYFSKNMKRILLKTKNGEYVKVVQEVLEYMYSQAGGEVPAWVKENKLMRFRGVELIPPILKP